MAKAAFSNSPPRLPRSMGGTPFRHSNACRGWRGNAYRGSYGAQEPDAPTACPWLLIQKAAPSVSPGYRGSARACPAVQSVGRNCSTWGAGQLGSAMAVSEYPATWPPLLMAEVWPLVPPSVLNGVMVPFCQTKPRQIRLSPNEQKFSLLGSVTEVSAVPAT